MFGCDLVEIVVIVTQSNDIATNGFENLILLGGTHSQKNTPHFCNSMNEWIHLYTWVAIKSIPHRMKLSFCFFFSSTAILENNQQQPNETVFIFEWEFLLLLLLFTLWSQLVCWWINRNAQLPPTNYKNVEKFNVFLLCVRVLLFCFLCYSSVGSMTICIGYLTSAIPSRYQMAAYSVGRFGVSVK